MPVEITQRPPSAAELRRIVHAEAAVCLRETGRYVQAKAAKYPPKADSSSYRRTGTLGRSIAVGPVTQDAGSMYVEVGTNVHYAKYVEYGTGIYGPNGVPIRPKTAKVLAWRSTGAGMKLVAMGVSMRRGKLARNQQRDQYMIFAREVKGMRPWHFMQNAFESPETEAYYKARIEQMFVRIAARTGGAEKG